MVSAKVAPIVRRVGRKFQQINEEEGATTFSREIAPCSIEVYVVGHANKVSAKSGTSATPAGKEQNSAEKVARVGRILLNTVRFNSVRTFYRSRSLD